MDTTLKESISEVHQHVIHCAHKITKVLIEQRSFDVKTAQELLLYALQLFKLTPEVTRPVWLEKIIKFENKSLNPNSNPTYAYEFAALILSNIPKIESQIPTPDEVKYDFDVTFDAIREEEQMPAAFDNLIASLEEIIAKDLIDSRVVQEALERLMALLKRNKHGSLTSILVSLHYGRFALKAFGGILSANKYLKPMVDAFKEEFTIAEAKVQKVEEKLKEAAIRRLTNEERLTAFLSQNGEETSKISGYLTNNERLSDTI